MENSPLTPDQTSAAANARFIRAALPLGGFFAGLEWFAREAKIDDKKCARAIGVLRE